jgi:uncharacterized protein (DUF1330 family)
MPAYLIVNYNVENPERYGEYSAAAGPVMKIGEAAQILAFDPASEKLEGSPGHQTIVLSFDSMEKAKEIYESGEYQKLIPIRQEATSNHFAVLVNGIG